MATSCSSDWRSSRPGSLMTCGAGPNSYTSSALIEPTRWAAQPASDWRSRRPGSLMACNAAGMHRFVYPLAMGKDSCKAARASMRCPVQA